ncbi:radical SAM protein [Candidatus Saganbacteria bacterium]|nr:radical SAM protein [Candidatus Saganbacteria bacterium]
MTANRVLLINSNREVNPNPVLPIGMAYVASSLAKNKFTVACADLCFKANWRRYLKDRLNGFKPDFIGLSIRNIDNHDQSKPQLYLDFVKEVICFCQKISPAKIFCGGAALAVMPTRILDYLNLDTGIFGDGEETTPLLLRSGLKDLTLPGLAYKKNEKIYSNPALGIKDLNSIPHHELARWIDIKPYFRQEASYPVQAKRGCPFDCLYCTYPRGEGKGYRFRKTSEIIGEIIDVQEKYHPKTIEFVDSIFNHPPGFAEEICRQLIARKSRANLHTIELNPLYLTDELIGLMEKAGFISCGITCESASEIILKNFKKNYGAADVRQAAGRLKKSAMKKLWIFLFGGPGEDANTVEETLKFTREELGENDVIFFNIGVRIYPGTGIEAIARRAGVIKPETDLLFPTFYVSPLISRSEIEAKIKNEKNDRIVTIKDIRLPYLASLLKLSSLLGLKGPYWSYTPIFNKIRKNLWPG